MHKLDIQGDGKGNFRIICVFKLKLIKVLTNYSYKNKNLLREILYLFKDCSDFNEQEFKRIYQERLNNDKKRENKK